MKTKRLRFAKISKRSFSPRQIHHAATIKHSNQRGGSWTTFTATIKLFLWAYDPGQHPYPLKMVKVFHINVNCRFSNKERFEIHLFFAFSERLLWRPRSWTLLPKTQKWPRCKIRGKRGGKNLQQFYSTPRRASGWQAKWLQFANSDIPLPHLKKMIYIPCCNVFTLPSCHQEQN